MGRLIDADALKRKEQQIATQAWKMNIRASVETILNQFIDDIDHAPTVDAVPCDVCRYSPPSSGDGKPCTICPAEGKDGDNHD